MNLFQDISSIFTVAAFALLFLAVLLLIFGLFVDLRRAIRWLRDCVGREEIFAKPSVP